VHLGWHQLADEWARRLVACADIEKGDLVLDIGAGRGALTAPLVRAGARVIAVELHPGRAQFLRETFVGSFVVVVHADASDLRLPRRPFHVVANPPFAITTALLRRLVSPGSRLVTAHVVVPRHVAARWARGRGAGTQRWSSQFAADVVMCLPRCAFRPPPPGEVALLRITRRTEP
jgi:23S rRNA (adenine-N6)-dimethyltransferase